MFYNLNEFSYFSTNFNDKNNNFFSIHSERTNKLKFMAHSTFWQIHKYITNYSSLISHKVKKDENKKNKFSKKLTFILEVKKLIS